MQKGNGFIEVLVAMLLFASVSFSIQFLLLKGKQYQLKALVDEKAAIQLSNKIEDLGYFAD